MGKGKAKTFDMFDTQNIKTNKEKSKEVNATNSKESDKNITEKREGLKKSRIMSRFNSDSSDSDQGLVIAENNELDTSLDEDKKKVEEKKVAEKKVEVKKVAEKKVEEKKVVEIKLE